MTQAREFGAVPASPPKAEVGRGCAASAPAQAGILVVEDDATVRTVLAGRLRAVGHAVQTAADGLQGLEAARRLRPDIVLTDWIMPEMNGVDLIRLLRADQVLRHSYVILLTSRDAIQDRVAGLEQGADEYLIKPWSDEELLARIQTGLRIQRLQRELAVTEHKAALLTLAATLGHEINNPLTVLSATLQIARSRPPSGSGLLEFLNRCAVQVERIAGVVATLRQLSDPSLTTYLGSTTMLDLHGSGSGCTDLPSARAVAENAPGGTPPRPVRTGMPSHGGADGDNS